VGALRPSMADLSRLLGREPPSRLAQLAADAPKRDAANPKREDNTDRRELGETAAAGLVTAATPALDILERIARVLDRPVALTSVCSTRLPYALAGSLSRGRAWASGQ
jgi:hypothetical protein